MAATNPTKSENPLSRLRNINTRRGKWRQHNSNSHSHRKLFQIVASLQVFPSNKKADRMSIKPFRTESTKKKPPKKYSGIDDTEERPDRDSTAHWPSGKCLRGGLRDGSHNAPSAGSKCVLSACNCLFNVCLSLSENDALVLQSSLGVAKWGGSLRTGSGWIIQSADHQTKCYANSQSRQAAVVGSHIPSHPFRNTSGGIPECFRRIKQTTALRQTGRNGFRLCWLSCKAVVMLLGRPCLIPQDNKSGAE